MNVDGMNHTLRWLPGSTEVHGPNGEDIVLTVLQTSHPGVKSLQVSYAVPVVPVVEPEPESVPVVDVPVEDRFTDLVAGFDDDTEIVDDTPPAPKRRGRPPGRKG
jgi:hypothetical protein